MKNKIIGIVLSALMISSFASAQTRRQAYQPISLNSNSACIIPKLEGERVPFPRKTNTKFELAAGETYLINGYLVLAAGKVMLKVDFNSQPWLATAKMLANPYFDVASIDVTSVRQYAGKLVQVVVVANLEAGPATREAEMQLTSILPPMLFTNY